MQKDHIQINAPNLTYKRCVRRTKRRLKKINVFLILEMIPVIVWHRLMFPTLVVDFHKNPCDKLLKLKFGKPFYM